MSENQFEVKFKVKDEYGIFYSMVLSLDQLRELDLLISIPNTTGGWLELTNETLKDLIIVPIKKGKKKTLYASKEELEWTRERIKEEIIIDILEE